TVTVAPALLTGRMVYLRAMSAGMILITDSSISMPFKSTEGTLKCCDSDSTSWRSVRWPSLMRLLPSRPPCSFCRASASWSCMALILPVLINSSPNLPGAACLRAATLSTWAMTPAPSGAETPLQSHPAGTRYDCLSLAAPGEGGNASSYRHLGMTMQEGNGALRHESRRDLQEARLGLGEPPVAEAAGEALPEGALGSAVGARALGIGGTQEHEDRGAQGVRQVEGAGVAAQDEEGAAGERREGGEVGRRHRPRRAAAGRLDGGRQLLLAGRRRHPGGDSRRRREAPRRLPPPGRRVALVAPAGPR